MKSIFDLKTKNSDLSSANQGLANYRYQEVQSLRNVQSNKFADGEIIYRWTYGSNKYWIPSKSYLKITVKLTDDGGDLLNAGDNLCFAMNTAALLFQASSYKIADQTVCNNTQNFPQISCLRSRLTRSDAWLQGIGQSTNNWSHKFEERLGNTIYPGNHYGKIRYMSYREFLTRSGVAQTATITIAANPFDDGTFTLTSSADPLWTADALGIGVGDIIEWSNLTALAGAANQRDRWTAVIISITATVLTVMPHTTVTPLGPVAYETDAVGLTMDFYRNALYDTQSSQRATIKNLIWRPTLSVFDSVQTAIPCAGTKHEFTLTPYPEGTWQKNIIQSIRQNKTPGTGNDYDVSILDVRFYILTCDSNKIQDNFQFMLDLNEIQCQSSQITDANQQQSLDVIGSTDAITIAFQDEDALNNTLYPMSFFKVRDNIEWKLRRYYIRYEGQVPQPDGEGIQFLYGNFDNNAAPNDEATDTVQDWYHRTKIYDGTYFMESPETLETWRARGMYIHHRFPKTASSRNTRVYVQTTFQDLNNAAGAAQKPFLLLFSHYKKVVLCKVVNGRIETITPIDA